MTKAESPELRTLPRPVALGVAFIAGWAIMHLEILGGRVLAPYFGYSVYQWGALIGVVMTALAIGYWLGGRVGDGPRAAPFLLWALGVSALFVVIVPPFATTFMPVLRVLGPGWGAVAATMVLLGLPSVLLATTSPIVIRLTATDMIARTAGRVYAVSTAGSIGGTFFAAFYVIPELGSRIGHFVAAGLIIMAAAALAASVRRVASLAVIAIAALGLSQLTSAPGGDVLHREETVHNIITVRDVGNRRLLFLNYEEGAQTIMDKGALLTGSYYDTFLVGPHIAGGGKVLFLGSAGGTALRQIAAVYPDARITGVDLDERVIAVSKQYFGLSDQPRIDLVAADARWFLENAQERYDVICVDLYVTGHVPFFTTTQEFFGLVRDHLTENGVLMMNILSPRPGPDLVAPFVRTVRTALPSVFLAGGGNVILIGTKRATSLESLKRTLSAPVARPELAAMMGYALKTLRPASADPRWPIFTDDRNDVEFRTFRMLYGS